MPTVIMGDNLPPPVAARQGSQARLVTEPGELQAFTGRRDTDATTAILRGLAEYLGQLEGEGEGGRVVRFEQTFAGYPQAESLAAYPSLVVLPSGRGEYESGKLTPTPSRADRLAKPDGRFIISPYDLALPVNVVVYAQDEAERSNAVALIEDAFAPVSWRGGFRLELPFYHGARAAYEILGVTYDDSQAAQRIRLATIAAKGRVPVVLLREYAEAKPRYRIVVT